MGHILMDALSEFEKDLYNEWTKGGLQQPLVFESFNKKTTVCILKLANNFEIIGTSGCEDPSKFDEVLGKVYALKDALRKLGEFAAFYRAQKSFDIKHAKPLVAPQLSPFEIEEIRRMIIRENQRIGSPAVVVATGEAYATTSAHKFDGIKG